MKSYLLSCLCVWTLVGCDKGGQSGSEVTGSGVQCDEVVEVLANSDLVSTGGFRASDILGFSIGSHTATTTWRAPNIPIRVDSNGAGDVEVTLEVEYLGGAVRYVESTYVEPEIRPGHVSTGIAIDTEQACPDRLEVDVRAGIRTSDGLLDETAEATLISRNAWTAELVATLALEELQGGLALTLPEGSRAELQPLEFRAQLAEGLFSGALTGAVQESTSAAVSAGLLELLRFGPNACDLPGTTLPANVGSPPASSMLEVLNQQAPIPLGWANGERSVLTLTADMAEAFACQSGIVLGNAVILDATVSANSDDGRIASTLGVELHGMPTGSESFSRVEIIFQASRGKAVPVDEFEATFGIGGVDLSGFDLAALDFQAVVDLTGAAALASGRLSVVGLTTSCPSDPSSCPFDSETVVDSASW